MFFAALSTGALPISSSGKKTDQEVRGLQELLRYNHFCTTLALAAQRSTAAESNAVRMTKVSNVKPGKSEGGEDYFLELLLLPVSLF